MYLSQIFTHCFFGGFKIRKFRTNKKIYPNVRKFLIKSRGLQKFVSNFNDKKTGFVIIYRHFFSANLRPLLGIIMQNQCSWHIQVCLFFCRISIITKSTEILVESNFRLGIHVYIKHSWKKKTLTNVVYQVLAD